MPIRLEAEEIIIDRLRKNDIEGALTEALRAYGSEINGFIHDRLRDETRSEDAFALFCEDMWKGLRGFEGRASVRVWAYVLARRASDRVSRDGTKRAKRQVPWPTDSVIGQEMAAIRSTTPPHERSSHRNAVRALWERLSPDDRALLALRVDKRLSFLEITRVLGSPADDGNDIDPKDVARVRKRFQQVKERLKKLAAAEGLTTPQDPD